VVVLVDHNQHPRYSAMDVTETHSWVTQGNATIEWIRNRKRSDLYIDDPGLPRERWHIWGDPHLVHPNGVTTVFKRSNGLFTLTDGTHLVAIASGALGDVHEVLLFAPGTPLTGFDKVHTTNYGRAENGFFVDHGPLEAPPPHVERKLSPEIPLTDWKFDWP
jgi:hypothetical protein